MNRFYCLFSIALLLTLATAAAAQSDEDHPARAELLADVASIQPGRPFNVGIRLTMRPGWHVYWINPGDSGEPPHVKWTLPNGFTASELRFPIPGKFEQAGGLVGYGYEDEVLLTATITPPPDLKRGSSIELGAEVSWLVCDPSICIPGDAKLNIDLAVSDSASVAPHAAVFQRWRERLPKQADAAGAEIHSTSDPADSKLYISVKWKEIDPKNVEWFPPPSQHVEFSDIETTSARHSTAVRAGFRILTNQRASGETLYSVLAYDAPDGARHGVLVPIEMAKP